MHIIKPKDGLLINMCYGNSGAHEDGFMCIGCNISLFGFVPTAASRADLCSLQIQDFFSTLIRRVMVSPPSQPSLSSMKTHSPDSTANHLASYCMHTGRYWVQYTLTYMSYIDLYFNCASGLSNLSHQFEDNFSMRHVNYKICIYFLNFILIYIITDCTLL